MSYRIEQEKFQGPLDVLLELIQSEKLSVNEISLAKVTDGFIMYLKTLERQDQEVLAEFLVVASQLLLIKSRSLLPEFQASPEEEETANELAGRLADYQRLKELSHTLGMMAALGPKSFSREAWAGETRLFFPPKKTNAKSLRAAFAAFLEAIPKVEKLVEEKIRTIISLEEKIKELQSLLTKNMERVFSEIVAGAREKVEIIVSFLAILELSKQKLVSLDQDGLFGSITIRKTS